MDTRRNALRSSRGFSRHSAPVFLAVVVGLLVALVAPRAFADAKVEAAAKALQKKAMEDDYLTTEFAKAQEKLEKAIAACGADKCSAPLRAQLKRDLGVVQIGGQTDKEKGHANFVEAIKLDPTLQLDPDLKTKELEAAWESAKKGGGAAPTGAAPAGDFTHTPVAEQQSRTAVPVYVEYAGEEKLVKVIARYKGFGMTEWKSVELKKMGEAGWGGMVPCGDVQQGALQYYLQGFNAANDPVATAGDRNSPYKVPIKREKLTGEAPHLPGQPAPSQCADTGDCPPDFPGCKKSSSSESDGKAAGEKCDENIECKSGSCEKGECASAEGAKPKMPRFWVGAFAAFSMSFIPSADDVCKLHPKDATDSDRSAMPVNDAGYYCIDSNGGDYPIRPPAPNALDANNAIAVGKSDKVAGGGAPGGLRLYASFDYAVNANILAGIRAGVVIGTYPGQAASADGKSFAAAPLHLELRGTYVLGKDALAKAGFAPFAFAAAGVSTWDSKVAVSVVEVGNPAGKTVDTWHVGSPVFIGLGGGGRYAFTPRAAVMGGLRVDFSVGNGVVPNVGPELGVQFGF